MSSCATMCRPTYEAQLYFIIQDVSCPGMLACLSLNRSMQWHPSDGVPGSLLQTASFQLTRPSAHGQMSKTVNMLPSDIEDSLLRVACWFLALGSSHFQTRNIEWPRVLDATLDELRAGLDSSSSLFTSVHLVQANIARIVVVNPVVHVVNEMDPEVISMAAGKDAVRSHLSPHCHVLSAAFPCG
ncbi:hypothetical protein J3458_015533 [Metarhizium acridum]|uniref:uncharacterized protein n=1 Tax=Metarhizium acridum TaxID=92637 RepID=UPI001C6B0084|nr:hypothetical protein J3458_015533 [Metarhizium acridum]